MSEKGIPSPFGFGGGQLPPELAKQVDDIARAIQPSLQKLAEIVYEHNLNCFDMVGGIKGIEVHLGVHNPKAPHGDFDEDEEMNGGFNLMEMLGIKKPRVGKMPPIAIHMGEVPPGAIRMPSTPPVNGKPPADDLLEGVEALLRRIYKEEDTNILGMIYSPHKSAAFEIAKILEASRKRDQKSIADELQKLVDRFRV